ncbi:MAG: hypothetical protein IPJ34_06550 [Myxococcales bacterium]|nr:hypothetical protein [Myxococcales bacterium]
MDARSHEARHTPELAAPAPKRGRKVASHHALYERIDRTRCDVCDVLLADVDAAPRGEGSGAVDGGPSVDGGRDELVSERAGAGLYLWTRGRELRFEEAPLCARCGPAIAITAMRRWLIEDEEEG